MYSVINNKKSPRNTFSLAQYRTSKKVSRRDFWKKREAGTSVARCTPGVADLSSTGIDKNSGSQSFFCFFLYSPITNPIPKHCQFLLIKYHKRCWQKYTTTHCEETREDYEPNRPFITSDITVKASCTCKLLRLLPDMVRLIMELDGNCSFTLTTANGGKMSRLPRLKAAVSQGSGLTPLLVNIYTSYILTGIKPAELRSQTNRIVSSTLGHGVWTPAPLSAHVHRVQMHGVSN